MLDPQSSARSAPLTRLFPTPAESAAYLDRFVHGQRRAKLALATAAYRHYVGRAEGRAPRAQHVLFAGPTGSGKTLLVRTFARWLGVPVHFAAATDLCEVGYKGQHVGALIAGLVREARGDLEAARWGIVCIDEFDKLRRSADLQRDVSGEGVQNGLLALIDGRGVEFELDGRTQRLDSSGILWVVLGAFSGLDALRRARVESEPAIGFGAALAQRGQRALPPIEPADLEHFGLIPELVGRFPHLVDFDPLSECDLMSILTASEGSVLHDERELFRRHGVELRFTRDALRALAGQALARGTGARGLDAAVRRALGEAGARLPDYAGEGVVGLTVDRAVIEGRARPRATRGDVGTAELGVELLRQRAGARLGPKHSDGPAEDRSCPPAAAQQRYRELLREHLALDKASAEARLFWEKFERSNRERPDGLLRVAEDLRTRRATIGELHNAWKLAGTESVQAVLCYLDYLRARGPGTPGV